MILYMIYQIYYMKTNYKVKNVVYIRFGTREMKHISKVS